MNLNLGLTRGKGVSDEVPAIVQSRPFVTEATTAHGTSGAGRAAGTMHRGSFTPRGAHDTPIFKEKELAAQRGGLTCVVSRGGLATSWVRACISQLLCQHPIDSSLAWPERFMTSKVFFAYVTPCNTPRGSSVYHPHSKGREVVRM